MEMRLEKLYLIKWGAFYSDGYSHRVAFTKEDAEAYLRKMGFKFSKKEGLFLGKILSQSWWAKVVPIYIV